MELVRAALAAGATVCMRWYLQEEKQPSNDEDADFVRGPVDEDVAEDHVDGADGEDVAEDHDVDGADGEDVAEDHDVDGADGEDVAEDQHDDGTDDEDARLADVIESGNQLAAKMLASSRNYDAQQHLLPLAEAPPVVSELAPSAMEVAARYAETAFRPQRALVVKKRLFVPSDSRTAAPKNSQTNHALAEDVQRTFATKEELKNYLTAELGHQYAPCDVADTWVAPLPFRNRGEKESGEELEEEGMITFRFAGEETGDAGGGAGGAHGAVADGEGVCDKLSGSFSFSITAALHVSFSQRKRVAEEVSEAEQPAKRRASRSDL